MEDKRNITLFIDKRPQGIIQPVTGTFGPDNPSDFYLSVALYRTSSVFGDYVDVYKDSTRYTIERQEINPYFIELGFFSTVTQVKNNAMPSSGLTTVSGKAELNNITINS